MQNGQEFELMTAVAEREVNAPMDAALADLSPHLENFFVHRQELENLLEQTEPGVDGVTPQQQAVRGRREDARHHAHGVIRGASERLRINELEAVVADFALRGDDRWETAEGAMQGINTGLRILGNIAARAESTRGLVAIRRKDVIEFYRSEGADDLVVAENEGVISGIKRVLDGYAVSVENTENTNFPNALPRKKQCMDPVLRRLGDKTDPWHDMRIRDPDSIPIGEWLAGPNLIVLGSPSNPGEDPNRYFTTDKEKFAARMLARTMRDQWICVTPPGDELRMRVVNALASIYAEVLLGLRPRDVTIDSMGKVMTNYTPAFHSESKFRTASLADATPETLSTIIYGADAQLYEIREATHRAVDEAARESGKRTARNIFATDIASSSIDSSLDELFASV